MKRFGDLIGAAVLVAVTGYMTIRLVQEINKVLQPINTAAEPQEFFEPQAMDATGPVEGWRAIDPTEFALPDNERDQIAVLKPGESLLPWLEDDHV
jgi:hypothetical protein